MLRIIFCFILAIFSSISFAQHADCETALEMKSGEKKYIGLSGWGKHQEIIDSMVDDSIHWFSAENNICWLKLPIIVNGELTVDIEGSRPDLRLNFILLKYNGASFCKDVKEKKIVPLRSNFAFADDKKIERTGLSTGAKSEFVAYDGTDLYSKSIGVKPGEIYMLVINGGSKITGNITVGYEVAKGKTEFEKSPHNLEKKDLSSVPFNIKIVDDATGQPVVAKIAIDDLVPLETVKAESSEFNATLSSSQSVRVDCNAPGYMFFSQGLMAPMLDPADASTYQPVNLEIRLKKLKEGDKVALRNIRFQPDKAEFMPGSYPALQSLTNFLQTNPSVKIEIGGHINGPDGSSAAGKAMSKKRAKAVYDYLLKRGIDKSRLKYKGYGNSQMIWPDPQNERQAEENRRVEIKVISQ